LNARRRNRCSNVFAQRLQAVAREVDDVRALTWSPDLSDALGRMQIQMRRLANELNLRALCETGSAKLPRAKVAPRAETGAALDAVAADNSWPYLAI
jgi:hypothetical protein